MINDLPVSKIEKYTVAGLILNELQISNRLWDLHKYLKANDKPLNKKVLYEFAKTIKKPMMVKIDQLKTMFDDDDFLVAISNDLHAIDGAINKVRTLQSGKINALRAELANQKMHETVTDLVELMGTNPKVYPEIVKFKAKIEVDILRMLAYAIADSTKITSEFKEILSKYVLYFNPHRLSGIGICSAVSIKFIRSILLENLHKSPAFSNACNSANKTYSYMFNLDIKDEVDLIFVYVMLMKQEINKSINVQEFLYYIFNNILKLDYVPVLYVISTSIEKDKNVHSDKYTKLNKDLIISLVTQMREKYKTTDKVDDVFEHLSFNCLRTFIFEDQKLGKGKDDYQIFLSYILFEHNLDGIRTAANLSGTKEGYGINKSKYYKLISDSMRNVLTTYPYIDLDHESVNVLIKNSCDAETAERALAIFNNISHSINIVPTLVEILDITYNSTNRHHKLDEFYYDDYKNAGDWYRCFWNMLDHMLKNRTNKYLTNMYIAIDIANNDNEYRTIDGVVAGELYVLMLNHKCLERITHVHKDIIIPYYMVTPVNMEGLQSISHAYVKYIYNKQVEIIDPNFRITNENLDASIADINFTEVDLCEQKVDDAYDHVTKYVMFYGGHEYPTWLYWAVPILVVAIIAVVIFAVIYYYSNNEEAFTSGPTCFWHNH